MLAVRADLLPATFEALRQCGECCRECVVFWTGPANTPALVDDVVQPLHTSGCDWYEIDEAWLNSFYLDLRSDRRSLRAQIHTHPGADTHHSPTDDDYPVAPHTGFISVVLPRFAHYLVAPSHLQEQLAPIIVCLLDQIRAHTYTRHHTWPATLFALDEAANIAPLPDLPAIVAEGASQGLVTLTCLQDLNQARHRWGRQADGFLTLHGIKIALGGIADTDTLRALSYLAGNEDITWKTHHGNSGLWEYTTGWTATIQQRPRIPPDHIRQMPPGIAYLAHTHYQPLYLTTMTPTWPVAGSAAGSQTAWERVKRAITSFVAPSDGDAS